MPAYVFETTIKMACWKRHTCVGCGCVYQYRLTMTAKGIADERSFSNAQAEKNGLKKLEQEVKPHPCPACGVFQPDMIAGPKLDGHNRLLMAVLVVVFVAALVAVSGYVPPYAVGIVGGILAAFAAACQIAVAWKNPNADLAANQTLAKSEMEAGVLQLIQTGDPATHQAPPVRARFGLGLTLVALAGPALIAPVLVALALGLPYHRDVDPHYLGAGDRMIVTFPRENVGSINGLWKGKASAALIGPNNASTPLKAVAGKDRYGQIILQKRFTPTTSRCELFAYIHLPSDASFDGEKVRVRLTMDVACPIPNSRNAQFYDEKSTIVTREIDVQLADRNHLHVYWGFWILALVAGWGGIVVGSGVLVYHAWAERSQAEGGIVIPVESN